MFALGGDDFKVCDFFTLSPTGSSDGRDTAAVEEDLDGVCVNAGLVVFQWAANRWMGRNSAMMLNSRMDLMIGWSFSLGCYGFQLMVIINGGSELSIKNGEKNFNILVSEFGVVCVLLLEVGFLLT